METNILISFIILLFITSVSLFLLFLNSRDDSKHYKKYKEFFEKYITVKEKYDFLKNTDEKRIVFETESMIGSKFYVHPDILGLFHKEPFLISEIITNSKGTFIKPKFDTSSVNLQKDILFNKESCLTEDEYIKIIQSYNLK